MAWAAKDGQSCGFLGSPMARISEKLKDLSIIYPICSMYGIFTNIWVNFRANVGKYSIHGASGYWSYKLPGNLYSNGWPKKTQRHIRWDLFKSWPLNLGMGVIIMTNTRGRAIIDLMWSASELKPSRPLHQNRTFPQTTQRSCWEICQRKRKWHSCATMFWLVRVHRNVP